jgi:uncharacterized protein (DUF433 family)
MESTGYHHIELRSGVPWIRGTQIKVVEIAEDLVRRKWDGQRIHRNYPWIALPGIYSALAYYYDHKAEIDAEMARREQFDEEMRAKYDDPVFLARAREMRRRLDEAKAYGRAPAGRRKTGTNAPQ